MSERPMAYEEVPGTRTLQQAVKPPQRERWAYEELQPGDVIEAGDQWQNSDGRWHALVLIPGASTQVRDGLRARRPHNITALQKERDEARAQGEKLSTELWARKPLEDRVAALTDESAQLRAERQEWIDRCNADSARALRLSEQLSAAEVAVKSAQRARDELQLQVDELRTDRDRLQRLIDNLLDEPTARQVRDMLQTWATELDWSSGCFGSFGRSQIDIIQQTMIAVIQRIGSMIDPEATSADA